MLPLRLLAILAVPLLTTTFAAAQGFSPTEAVKRMKLPDGFTVRCVASEPTIRQPVSMSFDERGRLWVLQYLQYPNPAGLKPVKQDQYLRTIYDRVPEPPPAGPKGLDRITILYDADEHGVYRKSKDFVGGLNLASGFCLGNGGVYVVQPPYLLFYADANHDDVPDGDPQVLLSGFGLNDTHSLANSLQWGPDGWLYGAAGSTSTCSIKNPVRPGDPPIEFQQGVWRFHPKTHEFELFSEGGGNTYGLDFDRHGQVIAGTNWGGYAMLHQMQGAYHVKGFSKHGPLHNPYTYGYFGHVPYKDFKGGHVTCGGILYQAETFPKEYRDQYIAGNLLSNAIYWHKLTPDGSTFKAQHGGDLLVANDTWFRPVDLMLGPDGSVYVADWTDRRAAHLDPVDNWDKTNGRIYKIEYKGTPKLPPFDLRKKTSAELVELLKHPNVWWRREARRLLTERQDQSVIPALKKLVGWSREWNRGNEAVAAKPGADDQTALEALWTVYCLGGFKEADASMWWLNHPNPHVRAWVVRFLGDAHVIQTNQLREKLTGETAWNPQPPIVRAQLACSARRLPAAEAFGILNSLLAHPKANNDPLMPLLLWWAIESKVAFFQRFDNTLDYRNMLTSDPVNLFLLERYARRVACYPDPATREYFLDSVLSRDGAPDPDDAPAVMRAALRGVEQGLDDTRSSAPADLREMLASNYDDNRDNELYLRVAAKAGVSKASAEIVRRVTDKARSEAERAKWVPVAAGVPKLLPPGEWTAILRTAKTDTLRLAALAAASATAPPSTPDVILARYSSWSPALKRKGLAVLLSRPAWALQLLKAYDAGTFPKADLSLSQARTAVALNDPAVTALVEKHFGKLAPATAGEKQARIGALNLFMSRQGPGDPAKGKALFAKHCAVCHTLFGEGGKIGPDLTTADRKNRTYMLSQVVDPSGYIRPEYVSYKVDTLDGRALTGLVNSPPGAETVTLVNVVDNQPQQTVVAKKDIDRMVPLAVSLMPEKLLDAISNDDVRHLFAYISSDALKPAAGKKLKVGLVSGSLEYNSDESLAGLQKYLEANYPVECVRLFRKTDADIPGLDQLANCDAAIFFTRRLKIDGDQLQQVKKYVESGKPVIGLRTASHGFQNWLAMDKLVFGGDYSNHYRAGPKCEVRLAGGAKNHPVLRGVKPYTSAGSLYKNPHVAADVTVLLTGTIPGHTEPVAWVRERAVNGTTQRVFYTSLGHPDDFRDANFTRLLVNALGWAAQRDLGR